MKKNKDFFNSLERRRPIILVLAMVCISLFLCSFVSATITKDFVKDNDKSTAKTNYGTITIKERSWIDIFGWSEKDLAKITLKENTEDCSYDCFAIKEITLYEDGKLVDWVRFETINPDGTRIEQSIRSWRFYYKEKEKDEWQYYNFQELKKGNYFLKLEGRKNPERVVDWIITSQGKEIEDWAVWSGLPAVYDNIDDSSIATNLWNRGLLLESVNGAYPASGTTTWSENTDKMTIESTISTGSSSEGTYRQRIDGYALPNDITNIENISFKVDLYTSKSGACSAGANIQVFGNVIAGVSDGTTDDSVWRITRNNSNYYDVYDDGVKISQIAYTDNSNISFYTNAEVHMASSSSCVARIYLYYVNYSSNNMKLNSPINGYISNSNSVDFNCSAIILGGATIMNISLWTNASGTWQLNKTIKPFTEFLYDDFNDLSLNASKWTNVTPDYVCPSGDEQCGWANETTYAGKTVLQAHSWGDGRDDDSGFEAWVSSTAIPSQTIIQNLSLHWYSFYSAISGGGCGTSSYAKLDVFGNTIVNSHNVGEDYQWTFNKNVSAGDSTFLVYRNGVFNKSITATSSVVKIWALCTGFTGSGGQVGYIDAMLDNVTYTNTNGTANAIIQQNIYSPTLWGCQACDSDGTCSFANENRTVNLDINAPSISILLGNGTYNYGSLANNHTINYTVTDVNLQYCWLEYNNTNRTIPCTSGSINTTNFQLALGNYNANIWMNDSVANVANKSFSWNYRIFGNSENYSATSTVSTIESFQLNITTDGTQIPIIYLNYNGTQYLSTLYAGLYLNNVSMNKTGSIPFFWNISYGSINILSPTYTQTVSGLTAMNITAGSCPAGLNKVMNFTFKTENNLTDLTDVTVKYNVQYGITDYFGSVVYGNTNATELSICLNTTQSPTYKIGYGEIEYSKSGYSTRRYYIFEKTAVSNVTTYTTLYSLPSALSTSFLIEVREPSLTPYVNKYVTLLKWYPNLNEYKVVEMGKTDEKGQTIFKVEVEDVDYRIGVYELDGTLIYLASPIRMACLTSPCSYVLNVQTTETYEFDDIYGIQAEITYGSGIFTLTYNDPSQNTQLMELKVYKTGGTASDVLICESNSTAFTGIIVCDVSAYSGILKAVAYRSASPDIPIISKIVDTTTTIFQGTFGLFLQFLITVVLVFMGAVSPIVGIILGLASLLVGVLLLKTVTYPIMIGMGVLGGLVIYMLRRSS